MKPETIKVQVHYIAAGKPFSKEEGSADTTVAALKAEVLDAFGLKETPQKQYKLYHGKTELTNPSETLGALAAQKRDLNLKLEEVLIQG